MMYYNMVYDKYENIILKKNDKKINIILNHKTVFLLESLSPTNLK